MATHREGAHAGALPSLSWGVKGGRRGAVLSGGAALLATIVPLVWTPTIISLDLASHTYGVWLTRLVREGDLTGLYLANQYTNVLHDWIFDLLGLLLPLSRVEWILKLVALLVLSVGSYRWIAVVGRNPAPRIIVPMGVALAHGTITQVGLVNFMFSIGLAAQGGHGSFRKADGGGSVSPPSCSGFWRTLSGFSWSWG